MPRTPSVESGAARSPGSVSSPKSKLNTATMRSLRNTAKITVRSASGTKATSRVTPK